MVKKTTTIHGQIVKEHFMTNYGAIKEISSLGAANNIFIDRNKTERLLNDGESVCSGLINDPESRLFTYNVVDTWYKEKE